MIKYLILIIFCPIISYSQISGTVSYGKAHLINDLSGPKTTKYTDYQIFKFELSRPKIIYWKGPIRSEFQVERIVGNRFFIKGKPWVVKVVDGGKFIIWSWGNGNDTVFNDVRSNNLREIKSLTRIWNCPKIMNPNLFKSLKIKI